MTVTLVVVAVMLVLIAVRQVRSLRLRIWQIVVAAAAVMLLTGRIDPLGALRAIDPNVMLFLFGVFVLGRALEASGLLSWLAWRVFGRARSVEALVLLIVLGAGAASTFLMNDTVAIVGTPVAVALARAHGIPSRLTLLALAFAVTAGSVVSPIGNPQNLLIALAAGGHDPFLRFAGALAVPTLGSLALTWLALRVAFRRDFHRGALVHEAAVIRDASLARAATLALALFLVAVAARIVLVAARAPLALSLTEIALAPAALLIVWSPRRIDLVRGVDWPTLAFFAALFVVVGAMDRAGVADRVVSGLGGRVASLPVILGLSAALSQLVSNVPFVAFYLPALRAAGGGTRAAMALAAGSTLAGNLTLIGAASNVIVVDGAERRFGERIGFWEFTRIGLPLAAAQLLLTGAWLALR